MKSTEFYETGIHAHIWRWTLLLREMATVLRSSNVIHRWPVSVWYMIHVLVSIIIPVLHCFLGHHVCMCVRVCMHTHTHTHTHTHSTKLAFTSYFSSSLSDITLTYAYFDPIFLDHLTICWVRSPHGIMSNVLGCSLEVSEFKLQSCCCVHFWTNILGKGINPLIASTMGLNSTTAISIQGWL